MADSQDKLTPADQQKLADLEKQLAKDKATAKNNASDKSSNKVGNKDAVAPTKTTSSNTTNKSSSASSSVRRAPSSTGAKTGALWLFTIINSLLLIGVLAVGYWIWMQWQTQSEQQNQALSAQQSNVQNQQAQVNQSLSTARAAENQLKQQNQALQSSIESLVNQLQVTDKQVSANQQNLADVTGRRPSDWLLAEADYLVRMAGRKLWLENDVVTASMMLESADTRLQDLNDPSLIPIREKLADDMQVLQLVNQVSIDSIALQVGALVKQVDTLPLAFFKKPAKEIIDNQIVTDNWRTNLARNWQQVTEDFFSVKRKTTEIKPFMSNQEQWLSKEQLKFALLQAQVAVLRENKELFQQSLQTSVTLTNEYFDLEQSSVKQFIESLQVLQTTDIEKTYPEQFTAAPLLQDIIERRIDSRHGITKEVKSAEVTETTQTSQETDVTEEIEAAQP
jgi:uroporphyrin-3 C-methyltransferase